MTTITVKIPMLPGKALNPNWRGHWTQRHRASKELKRSAYYCTLNANDKGIIFEKATVGVTFLVRDRRYYRDADNAIASIKPAIDGCVATGLLPDDATEYLQYRLPITYQVDKENSPMTILEFQGRELVKN